MPPPTQPNRSHAQGVSRDKVSAVIRHASGVAATGTVIGSFKLSGVVAVAAKAKDLRRDNVSRHMAERLINIVFVTRSGVVMRAAYCKSLKVHSQEGARLVANFDAAGGLLHAAALTQDAPNQGCINFQVRDGNDDDGCVSVKLYAYLPISAGSMHPHRTLLAFMTSWATLAVFGTAGGRRLARHTVLNGDLDLAIKALEDSFQARLKSAKPAHMEACKARCVAELGMPLPPYDHQVLAVEMMVEKEAQPPLEGTCAAVGEKIFFDCFTGTLHARDDDPMKRFRGGTMNLDVGLGKTYIALLLSLLNRQPPEAPTRPLTFRGTVFIVPQHLLNQWTREIARFAPTAKLAAAPTAEALADADLLLLSRIKAQNVAQPIHALRVVYDESHTLDAAYLRLSKVSAEYTWAMTATPKAHRNVPESFQMQFGALGLGAPDMQSATRSSRELITDRFQRLMIMVSQEAIRHLLPRTEARVVTVERSADDAEALARLQDYVKRFPAQAAVAGLWEAKQGVFDLRDLKYPGSFEEARPTPSPQQPQVSAFFRPWTGSRYPKLTQPQAGFQNGVPPLEAIQKMAVDPALLAADADFEAPSPAGGSAVQPPMATPAPPASSSHVRWRSSVGSNGGECVMLLDSDDDGGGAPEAVACGSTPAAGGLPPFVGEVARGAKALVKAECCAAAGSQASAQTATPLVAGRNGNAGGSASPFYLPLRRSSPPGGASSGSPPAKRPRLVAPASQLGSQVSSDATESRLLCPSAVKLEAPDRENALPAEGKRADTPEASKAGCSSDAAPLNDATMTALVNGTPAVKAESAAAGAKPRAPSYGECPVCLDVVTDDGVMLGCHVTHMVCHACLVNLEQPRACPLCRKPVIMAAVRRMVHALPPAEAEAAEDRERRVREQAAAAKARRFSFTSKIAAAVRMVADNARKSLVFVNNPHCAAAASEALRERGVSSVLLSAKVAMDVKLQRIDKFVSDDSVRCMVLPTHDRHQLSSGLNLTVADQIVFINEPSKASVVQQALGRCVRIGQPSPVVRVVHLKLDDEPAQVGEVEF